MNSRLPWRRKVCDFQCRCFFSVFATDPDRDRLTYSAVNLPSGATFNPYTRTFSWKPSYTQSGTYRVTLIVTDGVLSDTEIVTITVRNIR